LKVSAIKYQISNTKYQILTAYCLLPTPYSLLLTAYSLLLTACCLLPTPYCHAGDRPFNNAANWVGTGLMEIPTARVLEDGEIRAGIAQAYPFRWFGGAMGILPGMEADFRVTELLNTEISKPGWENYGHYKDKALDLKYQILPESKLLPAIAIGAHDIHGTKLYKARYLVLSRQIFPFDFTIGIGGNRLRGKHSISLFDKLDIFEDYGIFGGVEIAAGDRLNLMAEYNPVEYEKDKKVVVPEGASSRFNFGLRFKLCEGINLGLSYQRGDELGMMLHVQTALGKPLRDKRPDHPLLAPVDTTPFRERNKKKMVDQIYNAIYRKGFRNVKVYTDGTDIVLEFENTRYLSDAKAIGRVLRTAFFYSPKDTRRLIVISKRLNLHVLRVSVARDVLSDFFQGKISPPVFSKFVDVKIADKKSKDKTGYTYSVKYRKKDLFLGFKPDFEPYLNDPSGFFKCRLSIKPFIKEYPWDGGIAYARYSLPFYSDISTSLPPAAEDAIRSDLVDYGGKGSTFDRLLFEQIGHITRRTFGRISMGYFEDMFAGIGGEVLTFLGDGKLALGIEADWATKRRPTSLLQLEDLHAHSLLANAFYCLPDLNMILRAQYGKFLAKDEGWRFTVSREFDTGAIAGFWYSITDTGNLSGFNRDYHDKGVFISLPLEMFKTTTDTRRYQYSASPWTRDVAQTMRHSMEVYGLNAGLMPFKIKHNIKELRD